MRVAITTPTNWPYVRRGLERFVNELATFLSRRGHEVDIISTKPGPGEVVNNEGYQSVYHRQLWTPVLGKLGIWEFHTFPITLFPSLLKRRYDVVFCGTFLDSVVASMARKVTGVPCVLLVNAIHTPIQYFRSISTGGRIFRAAVRTCDEMIAISQYMQDQLVQRFARAGELVPIPVDLDQFRLNRNRSHLRPVILCTSALDDQRKGGQLLMQGFNRVKRYVPDAILRLSGQTTLQKQGELLNLVEEQYRTSVEFLGAGRVADLPELYGSASVTVLCSRWESFGMVVLESLSCGTPVVGANEGALPELLNRPDIGRLFDAGPSDSIVSNNVDGFASALRDALNLARDPATPDHCRERVEQFAWQVVGPRYEEILERVKNLGRVKKWGFAE